MLLRRKISIVAAAAVAIAVAIAIIISYFAVRSRLLNQVDSSLRAQADTILSSGRLSEGHAFPTGSPKSGGPAYEELVFPTGSPYSNQSLSSVKLPTGELQRAVAAGTAGPQLVTTTVDGVEMRIYVFGVTLHGGPESPPISAALELAEPLNGVISVLRTLRWMLAVVFLLVVGLAALLARMATRRVMKPLAEVTATAQLIGETDDLSRRIAVHEADEVGQLATSFNEMLERLETSRAQLDASVMAQRQLVADASHELRTPVTSLRTNIEVLLSGAELEDDDRTRLLTDVVEQSEELSTLVSDLIEVARGDTAPKHIEDMRLDRLAEDALDRARRNAPQVQFDEHLQPMTVQGNPERLIRAINNLLDNAALHAGHGGPVEVTVDSTGVTVRDHGDGIAEADLPHVFDRFYRGANSRARMGSGLGLAIVRQAAEQHGGSVTVINATDGGAVFTLKLPTSPTDADPAGPAPTESDGPWSDGSGVGEHDAGDHEAGEQPSVMPDDSGVPRDAEVSA
jgi:two-component system, OmpR family, sensor histidine kinase MprB